MQREEPAENKNGCAGSQEGLHFANAAAKWFNLVLLSNVAVSFGN
jgi:hypothetical protein